ncbi:I78 family peptidase inhibitor [Rhodobacteraceae bacterium DSL-40]|uniref:I78 family peptidase inhibitor n=1 Tax=Amaricoccus sp. B4 TaxID=3368557 RepID=UPI0013A700CD
MLLLPRALGVGLFAALAACTSSIKTETVEAPLASGSDTCNAAPYEKMVGQRVTVLNDADLPKDARVLFPGAAVTEEFIGDRLNITIGTDDTIKDVYCG